MWGSGDDTVSCIACGASVPREDAREYDKHGDRWDRDGKRFEYLCKPCFRDLAKQPRRGLEASLEAAGAGRVDDAEFVERFLDGGHEERHERE
ncbi:hypothetical protein [Halobacterium sp. R2-5]|uniref:DUF7562 family protein n=1 Tax=Halobacterium sp. R2-5 TaxID=2715751 RepID=UPI00141E7DB7|nr:hypothetical protein [Halobacterium sp. R2-5]NIB98457.1 hypothetical protein [Halobacterium sp. R2-5]